MLAALLAAATAAVVTSGAHAAVPAASPAWTPAYGPWIADSAADQVEVRWIPDAASDPGELVMGSAGTCTSAAPPIKPTVKDGIAVVRVEGLASDVVRSYCVRRSGVTAPARLESLPSPGARTHFVVFGDTRSDAEAHSRISRAILAENPDAVVNTGDLVENGTVDAQWRDFLRIEHDLLAGTPLLAVPGNHDERDLGNRTLLERYFPRAPWFEATVGAVRLLFLDSNRALDAGSAQGKWLRERLAVAVADRDAGRVHWIATVEHHPAFSSAHHGSDPSVQRELVPLFAQYHVDLALSGHDHDYERIEHGGVTWIVTGGGGAPLYAFGAVPVEGSVVRSMTHHYLVVDADAKALAVRVVDVDGNVIDRFERHAGDRAAAPSRESTASTFPVVAALLSAAAIAAWFGSARLAQ
ncbi:MAG TPA: metallophosphoesterase [bacterium]|nr:metallophosphoesterase [bacterium]